MDVLLPKPTICRVGSTSIVPSTYRHSNSEMCGDKVGTAAYPGPQNLLGKWRILPEVCRGCCGLPCLASPLLSTEDISFPIALGTRPSEHHVPSGKNPLDTVLLDSTKGIDPLELVEMPNTTLRTRWVLPVPIDLD